MTATPRRPDDPGRRIRRLLVALDVAADPLDALDDLAALASHFEATIAGLLVDDSDLLDIVGYRVVTTLRTSEHIVWESRMAERTVSRHMESARRAVELAAERRGIPVSFEQVRRRDALQAVRSAGLDDVIVVSRRTLELAVPDESAAATGQPAPLDVTRDTRRSVFVMGTEGNLKGPLYAAFDGTPSSAHALELAAAMAARAERPALTVFLLAADDHSAQPLRAQADDIVKTVGVTCSYAVAPDTGLDGLCRLLSTRPANGVLILGADQAALEHGGVRQLLSRVRCSVLLTG